MMQDFATAIKGAALVCTHSIDCSIRSLWSSLQFAVDEVVGKMTLEHLLPKREAGLLNVELEHSR